MGHESCSNKRVYFGLFLIAIGAIWIFQRLEIFPDFIDDILISWQMLLVGIGVFALIGGNRTTGIILILIGGFFMVPEMIQIPYELRRLGWPLLLVGIGVILLVRHRKRDDPAVVIDSKSKSIDYFDDFVIFGGREIFVNSQNLLGGKTTSIFGGTEYDMRRTSLSPNGAVVDCVTLFGGCTFKVPPDWTIKNEVSTIFGAFTDKRGSSLFQENKMDHSKTLVIKGFSAFGGIEVKLI